MSKTKTVLIGFLCLLVSIAVLPIAWATPLFAKWDKEPTDGVVRGDLPKWLSWFSTPDERLPGGMYEPKVADMYKRRGKLVTSMYWLGLRNRAHGFDAMFAVPGTKEQFEISSQEKYIDLGNGLWRFTQKLGLFKFVTGYRVYDYKDGTYPAIPAFTFKRD